MGQFVHYFIPLPEPVGFPDRFSVNERVADTVDARATEADHPVRVTFHQVHVDGGTLAGADDAVEVVLRSCVPVGVLPEPRPSDRMDRPAAQYTIVHASTPYGTDTLPPAAAVRRVQELPPSVDPLNRCVRLIQDLVRALSIATETPYGLVTYERLPSMLLFVMEHLEEAGGSEWVGPSLMLLDHANLPGVPIGEDLDDATLPRFERVISDLRFGNPVLTYPERFLEARRALRGAGDYGTALVLFQTASEVLLDQVFSLLLWEEGVRPEEAARLFDEGRVIARLQREFAPRLRGRWQVDLEGPVRNWYLRSSRPRNRVVHGGYRPTVSEADEAGSAVLGLERHLFDQLASRRNDYPRTTLMTIAEAGLRRRDMWRGAIRRFAEEAAPSESNWVVSVAAWRKSMTAALS